MDRDGDPLPSSRAAGVTGVTTSADPTGRTSPASPASPACRPRCPRCSYDLRGVVSQWSTECPVDGICAECGMTFTWRDVLAPWHVTPRWSIEGGPWIALPLRFTTTALVSAWPGRFWRRTRMEQSVRPGRLGAYFLGLALTPVFLWIVLHAAFVLRVWLELSGTVGASTVVKSATTHDLPRAIVEGVLLPAATTSHGTFSLTVPLAQAHPFGAGSTVAFLGNANPSALSRTPTALVLTQPYPSPRVLLEKLGEVRNYAWSGDQLPEAAACWVAGSTVAPGGPAQRIPFAVLARVQAARIWGSAPLSIPMLLLSLMGAAVSFIVLRTSAREARVSPRHLARIVAFGAVSILPALLLPLLATYLPVIHPSLHPFIPDQATIDLGCLVVPAAFLFAWWIAASRWYLRMRHGIGVGIAAASIGMLLSLLIFITDVAGVWVAWST